MCTHYLVTSSLEYLSDRFNAKIVGEVLTQHDIFPRDLAPVLLLNGDRQREVHNGQFALCPPGCPFPSDPKRPFNNARVESLDKWPWREAARETRCVVPMTSFREFCYWGETAGAEVEFGLHDGAYWSEGVSGKRTPQFSEPLFAAGLYRTWKSPDGAQQLVTMTLVMRPACEYIDDLGHHRQPLFIQGEGIDAWMTPDLLTTEDALSVLRSVKDEPELTHEIVGWMKPGWEKRVKANQAKREEQAAEISARGRVF